MSGMRQLSCVGQESGVRIWVSVEAPESVWTLWRKENHFFF